MQASVTQAIIRGESCIFYVYLALSCVGFFCMGSGLGLKCLDRLKGLFWMVWL